MMGSGWEHRLCLAADWLIHQRVRAFLFCCGIAMLLAVVKGQDANWDLRNYHYYDPYALLNDRLAVDIAPAQLQTWHSPLADLPYYWLASAGVHSIIFTALLALPAGLAAFLLWLIAQRLVGQAAGGISFVCLVILALTGASGAAVLGTTMSEWHLCALFLLAIWCLLNALDGTCRERVWMVGAGLAGGIMVGFKLTSAPAAVGLAVFVLFMPGALRQRAVRLLLLAIGGITGFMMVFGPWAWSLHERYGNPLFPYYNAIFHSPWLPELSYQDDRFRAESGWDLVVLPFRLLLTSQGLVTEGPMRDPRLMAGFLSFGFVLLRLRAAAGFVPSAWRALAAGALATYVLWLGMFGMYRYAGTMEALAVLALVGAVSLVDVRRRALALVILTVVIVTSTALPPWGRTRHGPPAVEATMPALPANAMVVIATLEPVAYLVPALPPAVPVVALINNVMRIDQFRSRMQHQATDRVHAHAGPLFLLRPRGAPAERYYDGKPMDAMLGQLGFSVNTDDCRQVVTRMPDRGWELCSLGKTSR